MIAHSHLLPQALQVVFLVAFVPVFAVFVSSFKTAAPVSFSALLIVIALFLLGAAFKDFPRESLQTAAGALFIVVGVSLFYSATSVLLAEEGIKFLPVLPLPRGD